MNGNGTNLLDSEPIALDELLSEDVVACQSHFQRGPDPASNYVQRRTQGMSGCVQGVRAVAKCRDGKWTLWHVDNSASMRMLTFLLLLGSRPHQLGRGPVQAFTRCDGWAKMWRLSQSMPDMHLWLIYVVISSAKICRRVMLGLHIRESSHTEVSQRDKTPP